MDKKPTDNEIIKVLERLKSLMRDRYLESDKRYSQFVTPEDIDNLLKELVGEDKQSAKKEL